MPKAPRSETENVGYTIETNCEKTGTCQFRDKEMREGQLITLTDPITIDECGSLAVIQFMLSDDPSLKQRLAATKCPVEAQYPDIRAAMEAEGAQANA